jgi:nucleoside-diphosphate-sugar epimerase
MIECNVIHQAHAAGVRKLLQLGSSCIYPRAATQPMPEHALLKEHGMDMPVSFENG